MNLPYEKETLRVQKHVFKNYAKETQLEMSKNLGVTLKRVVASRISVGGVVVGDKIVSIDEAKATRLIEKREALINEKEAKLKTKHKAKLNNIDKFFKKTKKEVSKNKYSNPKGDYKQQAREKMINAIMKPQSPTGTIPTLPFSTCELEQQLLDKAPKLFNFIGCEMQLDTFASMVNTIQTNKRLRKSMTPYFGLIGDKLYNAKENDFAHLILDYCGVLDTFKDEIKHTIDNNLVQVGGTINVTLSKMGISNNTGIVGDILSQFPKGMFNTSIGETELATKLYFSSLMGKGYVIEEFFNYQDIKKDENGQPILDKRGIQKKNMPMMLIIVRRVS